MLAVYTQWMGKTYKNFKRINHCESRNKNQESKWKWNVKKKLFHQTKKIKDRGYKLHTHTTREISEMSDDIYLLIINMLFVYRQRCQGMLIRDEKK